ncbi:MAG: ATP-binding protein [Pseudohongiellaceae bacterium]
MYLCLSAKLESAPEPTPSDATQEQRKIHNLPHKSSIETPYRFASLRDDPELLRMLFDINPTLVFVKDRQGHFVFANKSLADVYGTSVDELLGKTDADFNPDIDEIEHFLVNDLKVMDTQEELFIAQEKVSGPDGQNVWLQTIKRPLVDENGICNHLVGVSVDITQRIEAEERERRLNERLARYERLDSLGVMAGGIAHDLNNILGPLVGYPDLIRLQISEPKVLRLVDEIQKSAERATAVIEDLLTLARRGNFKPKPISSEQSLTSFLQSAALEKIVDDHPSVKLELKKTEAMPSILGSDSHFHQLLLNLVKNAFEAVKANGTVSIETTVKQLDHCPNKFNDIPSGRYLVVRIRDDGEGIKDADQERIFEPFFSSKKSSGLGTGLGLAMVYGVTKDMGAFIDVESKPGNGSTFTVCFPVSETNSVSVPQQKSNFRGNANLLVIDDLPSQRQLALRMLSSVGHRVVTATNAEEGLKIVAGSETKIDLVVIDMQMGSGADGLDTFRMIQKQQPQLPCLLSSGYSETDRVNTALQEGVRGFVRKPYTQLALGSAVDDALNTLYQPTQ